MNHSRNLLHQIRHGLFDFLVVVLFLRNRNAPFYKFAGLNKSAGQFVKGFRPANEVRIMRRTKLLRGTVEKLSVQCLSVLL